MGLLIPMVMPIVVILLLLLLLLLLPPQPLRRMVRERGMECFREGLELKLARCWWI